ncbi:DUF6685 family protein [Pseudomonas sp. MS19]|uniref:DUF6685 family protein n=1 Tax=Pseudomonas sp. MS19 TaxID=2579939 RepID=UPI001562E314|nr:DUF6685 family protein [Pseudomonas sp. MS19]NRH29514.1 hypothetical protein [Pseudomonas sp. MS19]
MSHPEIPVSISMRLSTLAKNFGLGGRATRQLLERASALKLPFAPLAAPSQAIHLQSGMQLQRLLDLPRSALSGPVQEDKALAHAALSKLVTLQERLEESFDLRKLHGFSGASPGGEDYLSVEAFAASEACRHVRIISYKDFVRTLSVALPRFLAGEPIVLRQTSWNGDCLYWASDVHTEELACAVGYARVRQLETNLPAQISRYTLNRAAVKALEKDFYVFNMPDAAWQDSAFMSLLLDTGLPYSRLSMNRTASGNEVLLLPKSSKEANALGQGLLLAGAPNVTEYLLPLSDA